MWTTAFEAIFVAALLGIVVMYVLHRLQLENYTGGVYSIGWAEFVVVISMMALIFTPTTLAIGKKLSVANIVTYEQWLNGAEQEPIDDVTTCRAGHSGNDDSSGHSNCTYTYVSGKYSYQVTYQETECTTNSKGEVHCRSVTKCCHTKWANIYSPYATREHRYAVPSSFGFKAGPTYHYSGVYLDSDPEPYSDRTIPANLPRGAPADWLDAKDHFDRGDPRPVTALDKYPNYILASNDETLKAYSADIERFKGAGLLPDHTDNIMSDPLVGTTHTQAKKLSFADVTVPNEDEWQDALMRFNAALGMKLQGDMHVVFVDAAKVTQPEAIPYLNALKAYWQGPAFGKRALAKNGVIVAIGISNNSTIEWAEASTGMPFGNELMAQYIRDRLPGSTFTPRALFGEPRTVITGDKAEVTLSSPRGTLEQIVFEDAPFARASMGCEGDDDSCVGFKDLLDTIEPTGGQKAVMIVVTSFVALLLWGLVAGTSFFDDLAGATIARWRRVDSEDTDPLFDPSRTRGRGKSKKNKKEKFDEYL